MSGNVQIQDAAEARIAEFLAILRKLKLRVGYQEGEGKERHPKAPHLAVAHLAAIHEFGSDDVPEQAFIRGAIRENEAALAAEEERQLQDAVLRVVKGADPKTAAVEALSRVGSLALRFIRQRLAQAKKSDGTRALDDTGTLARNLTWRVSTGRETFARGSA